MAATEIGVYTRQGGTWYRCNGPAGTSDGFQGIHPKVGSTWEEANSVRSRVSGSWLYHWTNIDGEINLLDYTCNDFDLSPYNMSAWFRFNNDGSIDRKNFGTTTNDYASWRTYDNGRDYEIKFEVASPDVDALSLTTGTWLNFTAGGLGPYLVGASDAGIGFAFITETQVVRIREKVSAPGSGNDLGTMTAHLTSEF